MNDNITTEHSSEGLQAKAKYIREEVDRSIKHVQHNRTKNQNRASVIKVAIVSFSMLATILLGLQIGLRSEAYFKQIAFVSGAFVTALTALEPFFNFRALWVEHELALARFYRIKSGLEFYISGTKAEELSL